MSTIKKNREPQFVNEKVSWQARLNNKIVMRGFIKPGMNKAKDATDFRRFATKADQWIAKSTADVNRKDIDVKGVPCQWINAPKESKQVLLYLHGGGFCIHLPKTYAGFVSQFTKALNINALIPDYRLAPEHPFPAGVDDCFNSYRWLLEEGYQAENIIIAGDSAGGCLTLTTLLHIKEAELPPPAAAILISPATDCRVEELLNTPQDIVDADPMFTLPALKAMISVYAPHETDHSKPLISPVFGDYAGIPPIQCHVGSTEILLSHAERLIEKTKQAGVDSSLHIWKEMPHVHPLITWLPESKQAFGMMTSFMTKHLAKK